MICKLFLEEGDYLDKDTLEPRNLVCGPIVYTPSGEAEGWEGFKSLEQAMETYNLILKPEEDAS